MRIAFAFVMLVASSILWLLDVTTGIYDFRTTVREDVFVATETTPLGTTANVTLLKSIYDDDTNTISYESTLAETPVFSSYNTITRQLLTSGLTANTSRILTVIYDTNALAHSDAIDNILDWWPFIWYMLIVTFPIAAILAIFTGR